MEYLFLDSVFKVLITWLCVLLIFIFGLIIGYKFKSFSDSYDEKENNK